MCIFFIFNTFIKLFKIIYKMILKVHVEQKLFEINVGIGLNDVVWLALASSRLYGKTVYP